MSEPIEMTFTISRVEYVRAMRKYNKTNVRFRRDTIGSILAIGAGIVLLTTQDYTVIGAILLVVGLVLLAMIIYILGVLPGDIYERAKRKLQSQYYLQFTENQIRFRYDDIDSNLKWSFYSSWKRDHEFYILYHDGVSCSVIPRRSLSENDDSKFADLLQRMLGPISLDGSLPSLPKVATSK